MHMPVWRIENSAGPVPGIRSGHTHPTMAFDPIICISVSNNVNMPTGQTKQQYDEQQSAWDKD